MSKLDIEEFLETGYHLKEHLVEYLQINIEELENLLAIGQEEMSALHPSSFKEENISKFYEDKVGHAHLFDLSSWHIGSKDYIADTLRLERMFAHGKVLDFGGGIGTHSIFAASRREVEHVYFVDLNPENREFVQYRANELGINDLISVHRDVDSVQEVEFDTLICLDVLEHLPNPTEQLLEFKKRLSIHSIALFNWYFFKGFKGEYPFHFDDKDMVENFFFTLQTNFMEVFHPFLITARSYKPVNN